MSVNKNPKIYYLKSTTSCLCVFYIRLCDSDLDADDNNSLVSEFSENDEIVVVDTSGMDEDWRLIAVTTAKADIARIN